MDRVGQIGAQPDTRGDENRVVCSGEGYEKNPKFGTTPDEQYYTINPGENTPKRYAEFAGQWKEMGAQIIGGCCATGPEHIKALRPIVKGKI